MLIAGPQAPFKTFAEFVTFAKAKPENLVYGHPGVAGQPHLVMLAVLKAIGADGARRAVPGRRPDVACVARRHHHGDHREPSSRAARAACRYSSMAIADERLVACPMFRTMKELGFPARGFSAGGLIVPAKTSDTAVDVLEKAYAKATAAPRIQGDRRAARGGAPLSSWLGFPQDVRAGT